MRMIKKKLLSLSILLMFVFSVLSVSMISVSAVVPDSPAIMVVPKTTTGLTPGDNFTVSIETDYSGFDTTAYQFSLFYNSKVLNGVEVTQGEVIVGGDATFLAGPFDNTAGELSLTMEFYDAMGQVTGMYRDPPWDGTLAYVNFTVVDYGASTIKLGPQTR
ncbi:MAG: cohesin domain-containing protein, partial [Candidatus Bathyarchaeia archaeon]